ncbi:MAG: PQQ-binding-like beta-propeller repeat protein [Desulfobacteraceae bacterium]|nr:PQQ-binding-like beta-propeller repeat protein [Desulfobacteraceae bacterium]
MLFIIEGTLGARSAHSYDGNSAAAPLLHIEYTSKIVDVTVSSTNDDAEESGSASMYLNSTDLELIQESTDQTVGIRFQNVEVPQGAVITSAYINFDTDETSSGVTSLTIKGDVNTNAPAFSSSSGNISSRTTTSQYVAWNSIASWGTVGENHNTPDLSTVVQAIVGSAGWASGNAMAFIITGSGKRVAASYDHATLTPPALHIEYSLDPVPYISTDSPALGASCYYGNDATTATFTITNTGAASMSYTVTDNVAWATLSAGSGTLASGASETITVTYSTSALSVGTYGGTITITDSNAPNSPWEISVSVTILALPAGTSCGNVPVYTENLVSPAILVLLDVSSSMTSMMNISPGVSPQTPELKTIVQAIVNRLSWVSGNAMAFIITGSGHRTAKSYDGSSGEAPLLHVEYTGGTAGGTDYRVSQSTDDAEESSTGTVGYTSTDLELVTESSVQTVGMRFQNVVIPQGATITNAYLKFEIDESQSGVTSLTIDGENADNPPTFAATASNISARTTTAASVASVAWNASTTPALAAWGGVTQQSRIDIGKDAISDLVTDRSISWGYGTWSGATGDGYLAVDNYTKIHVGTKDHTDAQQIALQAAITGTVAHSGTPFMDSLIAARKYFTGTKADEGGDTFTQAACQPMFLIDVTDGEGYYGSSVATINTETNALADNDISSVAVGFGIDNATQINEMAKEANDRGDDSETDDLYALHSETGGVGVPFLANNKQELVDAFSTIRETILDNIFYGSSPAPTTSADLGDTVLLANFDASDWTGDLQAVTQASDGDWDNVVWSAGSEIPVSRSVFTISSSAVVEYTDALLAGDNWLCKDIGDIINSTPVVVGTPPFNYTFDGYEAWKDGMSRDAMIYIGANDGALHAFDLATGAEKWAFVPENLQAKLMLATGNSAYDMCDAGYCHQYFVDGSPKAADIYDTTASTWKSILVVGEGEGGEAYFALDVTYGKAFDDLDAAIQSKFLWEFTDTELGQTWNDPNIKRVLDSSATAAWAVFFGSGYSASNQANKESYLYGIVAQDGLALWNDGTSDINRIKFFDKYYLGFDTVVTDFIVGEDIEGGTSGATATIVAIDQAAGVFELQNVTGTFVNNEILTGQNPSPGDALVNGTIIDSLKNDAPASPLVVDFTANGIYDQIYAGNLYGTMYRIAGIGKGENPSVSKLFDFYPRLTSPDVHPIRAQADYAYGDGYIWVLFGTGRYESQTDKTNMYQQYFFGIHDSSGSTTENNLSDLVSLTAGYVTDAVSGEVFRYISGTNPSNLSWAVSLDNTSSGMIGSERVIEKPLVVGNIVFFSTFIPDQNVCAGNGDSYIFALDLSTGQAPGSPVFDVNEDGVIDENDVVTDAAGNTHNVAGISVGDGQASNPVLLKNTLFVNTTGGGLDGIDVSLSGNRVQIKSWTQK